MRILVVLSFYAPHWTGLTKYAQRSAEGWAVGGDAVTVVCVHHAAETPPVELINGVRVIRCAGGLQVSRAWFAPSFLPTVATLLAMHDVVVLHTPLPEAAGVAALCIRQRIPYVCIHHGDVVMPAGVRNHIYARLMQWSAQSAFASASLLMTHSSDYADHSPWLAPFRWRVRVVTPPVPITPADAHADRPAWCDVPKDAFVVGIGGRMVHEKGFDRLLGQLDALVDAFPNIVILHAGAFQMPYEELPPVLRQLDPRHFRSVGLLPDDATLAQFFSHCAVVVVPSRTDCFPSFAVEALRCGVPLIVNDTPGLRSIIWQAGVGQIIDITDFAAIKTALAQPGERPDIHQMARIFDPQTSVLTSHNLIQTVVHARQSARDADVIRRHLANEVDMAYRRRVPTLMQYLELATATAVLDCGCGQGVFVQLLRSLTPVPVIGIDRDHMRLTEAGTQPVVLADLHALPFAAQTFDRVLLSEVLEHVPDDVACLCTLAQVMTPGGILALSVPCARYPFWWDPISRVRTLLGLDPLTNHPWIATIWSNHVRLYTPTQLLGVLEAAGLCVEEIEMQTRATVPFAHFIVYSIGKPLLDRHLLPPSWRGYADRRRGSDNDGRWWHPFNLVRRVFLWIDAANDAGIDQRGPAVTIVAKARKPYADAPL
ncbi:MAG: hypothetical protein RLY87_2757 [Chloroflexota bacterium]